MALDSALPLSATQRAKLEAELMQGPTVLAEAQPVPSGDEVAYTKAEYDAIMAEPKVEITSFENDVVIINGVMFIIKANTKQPYPRPVADVLLNKQRQLLSFDARLRLMVENFEKPLAEANTY